MKQKAITAESQRNAEIRRGAFQNRALPEIIGIQPLKVV
jgi:hypothetical protein